MTLIDLELTRPHLFTIPVVQHRACDYLDVTKMSHLPHRALHFIYFIIFYGTCRHGLFSVSAACPMFVHLGIGFLWLLNEAAAGVHQRIKVK